MSELSPQGGSEGCGACDDEVRVERRGKSSPGEWELLTAVNSIRSNTVGEHVAGPAVLRRWLERVGNGASR